RTRGLGTRAARPSLPTRPAAGLKSTPAADTWHQDWARSLGSNRSAQLEVGGAKGTVLAIAALILWVLTASAGVSLLSSGRAARGASAGPGQPADDAGPAPSADAAAGSAQADAAAGGPPPAGAAPAGSAHAPTAPRRP